MDSNSNEIQDASRSEDNPERPSIIRRIVLEGIRKACKNRNFSLVFQVISEDITYLNAKDTKGNTPLFFAIRAGDPGFVRFFLKKGANVNERGEHGDTPLSVVLGYAQLDSTGNEERHVFDITKILLEAGADPNVFDDDEKPIWWDYMVNTHGNPKTVKLLFEHGYNMNIKVSQSLVCSFVCFQEKSNWK